MSSPEYVKGKDDGALFASQKSQLTDILKTVDVEIFETVKQRIAVMPTEAPPKLARTKTLSPARKRRRGIELAKRTQSRNNLENAS